MSQETLTPTPETQAVIAAAAAAPVASDPAAVAAAAATTATAEPATTAAMAITATPSVIHESPQEAAAIAGKQAVTITLTPEQVAQISEQNDRGRADKAEEISNHAVSCTAVAGGNTAVTMGAVHSPATATPALQECLTCTDQAVSR